EGFEYGEVSGGNILSLKNSSKFIGELSKPTPCSFHINSFCSFSSASQSLLDAFLTRGVLFNFALDSYIFTLESEAQSFHLFDSYNGTAKDFYVMKEGREDYFAVIKGEKFKIHSPAEIEGNFFASSNLPFLFVSVEKFFHIIIPVPLSKPEDSYNFTFVKATCKDYHFNIEGHRREVDFAITYWLAFLRYYDKAMEYVSFYTSISFKLTEIEFLILRNILEIKHRDLDYLVVQAWANNLVGENDIFFKSSLNAEDMVAKITDIANLIPVIPFKYKTPLFSFLPNLTDHTHLWAYSNDLKISSNIGKPSALQPNISKLKEAINCPKNILDSYTASKLTLNSWDKIGSFKFPSCVSFLYDLADSSKNLADFRKNLNHRYLNFIRFYLEMEENSVEYKFACLSHVLFMVFNTFHNTEKLSAFISDLKDKKVPSRGISARISSPPTDYENLLSITMTRKALSSDLFKKAASFILFSDSSLFVEKLKSIVSTDELFSGFLLRALKDPKLLAQILLCGSVEELRSFFTVSDQNIQELLDLLWSHFITSFYCESSLLQENTFCEARLQKKEAFTQKGRSLANQPLTVTLKDKVFILIEFFTGYPLYEEQRKIISCILDKMMYGKSYVVQQGMAGGKTTRFGPAAAIVATSILRKLPIFIFPNSILNQNIAQLQQWLFDFFGKSVFQFKSERSAYGYSGPYLRHFYYRLTMAHHRGDVFVSSMSNIQCLLNARKELLLRNRKESNKSLLWVLRILHFIEHYSIFVLDEADEIMDASFLYNFDTNEPHQKNWDLINVLIDCFLFLRDKKVFRSQTGAPITIFEIKEPLTPFTVGLFKQKLNEQLKDILLKTSDETRVLIIDSIFVNCWEKVLNVGYGVSLVSPVPYPIPYSMANTPREGSSFGNQLFIIAISLKFYLENDMKDLNVPPLFFTEENIYSTLELYYDYEKLEKIKRETKSSVFELFRLLREKIYENDDNL
ncbi:hypothetical protein DI09_245p10, partial [Mitosporidium daphniae]